MLSWAALTSNGLIKLVYFSLTLKKSTVRWCKVGTKMSEHGLLLSPFFIKWHVVSYSKTTAWAPDIKCIFELLRMRKWGRVSPLFLRTCLRYCTWHLYWHLLEHIAESQWLQRNLENILFILVVMCLTYDSGFYDHTGGESISNTQIVRIVTTDLFYTLQLEV